MNLLQVAKMTEDEARRLLEGIRWPDGPVCPRCGEKERIYPIKAKSARPGLYECGGKCQKEKSCQFTVTVGTIMERSKIPLRKWVAAFYMMCSHKKGVSAKQLQRDLGLGSYQTAWHMAHRIRLAMKEEPLASLLKGKVEADETYIGGKSREGKRGRGSERKTPVLAMIERGGKMRSKPVKRVSAEELKGAIREAVDPDAEIHTDEWPAYRGLEREFKDHKVVRHAILEFARGDVHVNSAESFFALLKRGVHGTFHHVSKEHLLRYCDEFSFRWNTKDEDDGTRMIKALQGMEGKRLMYKQLIEANREN